MGCVIYIKCRAGLTSGFVNPAGAGFDDTNPARARARFMAKMTVDSQKNVYVLAGQPPVSVIFFNENENENSEKRENNEFVNEN